MQSIIQEDMSICFICGGRASEIHHVFGAANRKISERRGLKVGLCPGCHRLSKSAVHGKDGAIVSLALKKIAQAKYEETHTREEFVKEFGKNYL